MQRNNQPFMDNLTKVGYGVLYSTCNVTEWSVLRSMQFKAVFALRPGSVSTPLLPDHLKVPRVDPTTIAY